MKESFHQFFKRNRLFLLLNLLYGILYALISLFNHYNFRTYALDLGLYTRTLYDYAHLHFSYGEVFHEAAENILSDHFDLLLMLFSPLYWIFGSLTLLLVQMAAIQVGAWGTYRLAQSYGIEKKTAAVIGLMFLSSFGVFAAIAYDYHSNVVAACFLPWFILFFKEKKGPQSLLVFMLILVAKENMALFMFFVCTGLCVVYTEKTQRKKALGFALLSGCYFLIILFYVMPALSLQKTYHHFEFHILGNSFKDLVLNMLQHPFDAFLILFKNTSSLSMNNYVKAETWVFWFLSGGFLFFYRPVFLWMLIPLMMQKMFHDDPTKWSVAQQYNIELVPLSVFCLLECIKQKPSGTQRNLSLFSAFLCIAVTIRLCDHTIGFVDKTRIRFYQADHYDSDFENKADVYALLNKIPKDAEVSAENMFVPHLTDRKKLYLFPIVKNARYILLSDDMHSYPISQQMMLKKIDSLNSSPKWHHTPISNHLYLYEIIGK